MPSLRSTSAYDVVNVPADPGRGSTNKAILCRFYVGIGTMTSSLKTRSEAESTMGHHGICPHALMFDNSSRLKPRIGLCSQLVQSGSLSHLKPQASNHRPGTAVLPVVQARTTCSKYWRSLHVHSRKCWRSLHLEHVLVPG